MTDSCGGADGRRLLKELRARPPAEDEVTVIVWCLNELVDGNDLLDDIPEGLWHTLMRSYGTSRPGALRSPS